MTKHENPAPGGTPQNAAHETLRELYALDVAEVGEMAASRRWEARPLFAVESAGPDAYRGWMNMDGHQPTWRADHGYRRVPGLPWPCTTAAGAVAARQAADAGSYHRIMRLLLDMRMPHGTCQPRGRRACTACNAAEALDEALAGYKGSPVVPCLPDPEMERAAKQTFELSDEACDRLVAATMDELAREREMHALELNPDITTHHTLRRSLVRAAVKLGRATASEAPAAESKGTADD